MHKPFLSTIFSLLFIPLCFAQNKVLEYIPANSTYVFSLHTSSIEKKVGKENIKNYQFVEEGTRMIGSMIMSPQSELIREATLNPEQYGVVLKDINYAFAKMSSSTNVSFSIVFELSDMEKFKTLVDAYLGEGSSTRAFNLDGYNTLTKNDFMIAWQKDHAIVNMMNVTPDFYDDDYNESTYQEQLEMAQEALIKTISNLPKSESMAEHKAFLEWDASVNDMGMWINYGEMMQMSFRQLESMPFGYNPYLNELIPLLSTLYNEMTIGADVSFEKGQIKAYNRFFTTPEMMDFSRQVVDKKINKRLFSYIDGENVVAYMTATYSPENLYNGIKDLAIQQANNATPDDLGGDVLKDLIGIVEIFMDEKAIFNLLKGDILLAFNGVETMEVEEVDYIYNEETDIYEERKETVKRELPVFTFAFSYGNKEDMMKFIRIAERLGGIKALDANTYEMKEAYGPSIYIKLDKGVLAISNDKERFVQNKKYAKLPKAHQKQIKNHAQTVFLDIDKAIDVATKIDGTPPEDIQEAMKNIKDGVGDIWVLTHRPAKGATHTLQELTVDLHNKEEFAIKQLFDFINRQYLNSQKGI